MVFKVRFFSVSQESMALQDFAFKEMYTNQAQEWGKMIMEWCFKHLENYPFYKAKIGNSISLFARPHDTSSRCLVRFLSLNTFTDSLPEAGKPPGWKLVTICVKGCCGFHRHSPKVFEKKKHIWGMRKPWFWNKGHKTFWNLHLSGSIG